MAAESQRETLDAGARGAENVYRIASLALRLPASAVYADVG